MAVIINEFEVITEPAPAPGADAAAAPPSGQPPQTPSPADLLSVVRFARERAARLRAH